MMLIPILCFLIYIFFVINCMVNLTKNNSNNDVTNQNKSLIEKDKSYEVLQNREYSFNTKIGLLRTKATCYYEAKQKLMKQYNLESCDVCY